MTVASYQYLSVMTNQPKLLQVPSRAEERRKGFSKSDFVQKPAGFMPGDMTPPGPGTSQM